MAVAHYGTKPGHFETSNHSLSHELGSEQSERASERVSAAERASKASNGKQANQRANKQTQASGPVLTSGLLVDLAHSAPPYAAPTTFPINTNIYQTLNDTIQAKNTIFLKIEIII